MAGNDSITSHRRISTASIQPPESRPAGQAHAHDHRQQHRRQAHHQRDAGAVDQCRKNVTALVVRAQQIFGGAMLAPGGGRRASLNSSVARSKGLCGATQPAKTEQNTHTSAIKAATIAMGEVRKL